jgi:hypothetical protein
MGKKIEFLVDEVNDMIKMYCKEFESTNNIALKYHVDREVIQDRLKSNGVIIAKGSPYSKEYWLERGLDNDKIEGHIKTLRPVNKEYWIKNGYSEEEAKLQIEGQKMTSLKGCVVRFGNKEGVKKWVEREDKRSEAGKLGSANLQYWLNKGYSEDEAKIKRSERQTTFSKEICVEKYGKEEGLKRFNERQKKWLLSNKRSNFSKVSQKLFWEVINNDNSILNNEIFFATFDEGIKDESGKNYEYRLDVIESFILPDFFDKTTGRIIEFDGVYYHRKSPQNDLREVKRDKMIIDSGYKILHVNELEYKKNKQEIIDKCVAFLKGK